jgi:hypothetical protein
VDAARPPAGQVRPAQDVPAASHQPPSQCSSRQRCARPCDKGRGIGIESVGRGVPAGCATATVTPAAAHNAAANPDGFIGTSYGQRLSKIGRNDADRNALECIEGIA